MAWYAVDYICVLCKQLVKSFWILFFFLFNSGSQPNIKFSCDLNVLQDRKKYVNAAVMHLVLTIGGPVISLA